MGENRNNKKKSSSINNIIHLLRTAYSFSKSFVINSIIKQIIRSLLWVFYSAYFVRFILNVIENEYPLEKILISIGTVGGVSLVLHIYLYYCDYILLPRQKVIIYQGIYDIIYKKSENVEVGCYEDTLFYNKFSMALDGAGDSGMPPTG